MNKRRMQVQALIIKAAQKEINVSEPVRVNGLAKVTVMMISGKNNGEASGHGTNVGKVVHRSAAPNMLYKNFH